MKYLILACSLLFSLPALALAPVQEVVSKNGIKAWLIEDHTNPLVAMKFSFRGGAALDPNGKEGLARFVSSTLDEGAGDLGSQAFQARLEELSISLSFEAGMDSFGGQLFSLKENLGEAASLLNMALTQPRFDQEPVERIRSQILAGLRQAQEDPGSIATLSLYEKTLKDHPYARGSKGTLEGMSKITRTDLAGFVKDRLAQDNLVIGVSGDISVDELKSLLDIMFSGLPEKAKSWSLTDAKPVWGQGVEVIKKPIPQSTILLMQEGIDRHDPDFYPAYVLNYILGGGGFSSRLYEEVREKRGLVYSVYSYLVNYDHANLWMIGAGTQNARAKETLDVIKAEWQKALKDGVSAQEVMNAKTYLTGSFPLRFGSSPTIAGILAGMQMDNLPITFLETRNEQVNAVTLADVNRVAKRLLTPEKLNVMLVGEPEGIEQ
jgi:zinc protease